MGVVHLARHQGTGERVALKILRPQIVGDEEGRTRLAREVSSLERVHSRWVAEIIDADPWGEVPFVATRYVPGPPLYDYVLDEGAVRGRDLAWLARCLADGLAACHEVGVLHRDIKPSNVLMEGRTPVLIDFGLARVADDPKITHTGWLMGTPGYLPPEILHGEAATPASDVHSWAATVAYAATGRPPFGRGPSMAIMDRARRGQHDLDGCPEPLRPVLEAALDPDPVRRPGLDDVRAWLHDPAAPLPVVPAGPPEPLDADEAYATLPLSVPEPRPVPTLVDPDPWYEEPWDERPWQDAAEVADDEEPREGLPIGHWDELPVAPRVPWAERMRRGLLWLVTGAIAAAAVAVAPIVALVALALVVWVLRSGSMAASLVGGRRQVRGAKWYDGPRLVLGAPWDLVRAIPSTLLLCLWAGGFAVAGGLVCYAVAAPEPVTLFTIGGLVTAMLWSGPGGERVRGPLGHLVHPLSARVRRWLITVLVLVAVAGLCGWLATQGAAWAPWPERPGFLDVLGAR